MDVAPMSVVADTHVAHRRLRQRVAVGGHGHAQRLQAVGRGDDHPVAISLLHKVVMALYQAVGVAVELLIPLHGAEISAGKI